MVTVENRKEICGEKSCRIAGQLKFEVMNFFLFNVFIGV